MNAPGNDVIPPTTAAVNAGIKVVSVMNPGKNELVTPACRMPAIPPSSAAMPQMICEVLATLMPTTCVAMRSCDTARMARPVFVREKKYPRATASATSTPSTRICWRVTPAPKK